MLRVFVLALAVAGSGCGLFSKACTLIGCSNGIDIDLTPSTAGAYTIDATVDGKAYSCGFTLPRPEDGGAAYSCTPGMYASASSRDPSGKFRVYVHLAEEDAKTVIISVRRDGVDVQTVTFTPSYKTTPGPNGPDCDPPSCTFATFTLS